MLEITNAYAKQGFTVSTALCFPDQSFGIFVALKTKLIATVYDLRKKNRFSGTKDKKLVFQGYSL